MIGWKIRSRLPPIRIDEDLGPELADVAKAIGASDGACTLRGRRRQCRRSFAVRPQAEAIRPIRRLPPRQKGACVVEVG